MAAVGDSAVIPATSNLPEHTVCYWYAVITDHDSDLDLEPGNGAHMELSGKVSLQYGVVGLSC